LIGAPTGTLETGVLEAGSDLRGTKADVFPSYALAY
jgi:hypothetical protein